MKKDHTTGAIQHECRIWDGGREIPFLGIHKQYFRGSEIARKVVKAFLKLVNSGGSTDPFYTDHVLCKR